MRRHLHRLVVELLVGDAQEQVSSSGLEYSRERGLDVDDVAVDDYEIALRGLRAREFDRIEVVPYVVALVLERRHRFQPEVVRRPFDLFRPMPGDDRDTRNPGAMKVANRTFQ